MIGMKLRCPVSGVSGRVDATAVTADGKGIARIDDHWLFVDGLEAV